MSARATGRGRGPADLRGTSSLRARRGTCTRLFALRATRPFLLALGFLLLGFAAARAGADGGGGGAPTVIITPKPVLAGAKVFIEVSGMPDSGCWSFTVRYSKGGSDPSQDVCDKGSATYRSCVPAGAAGGTLTVTVEMDGQSWTETAAIRALP